MEATIFVGGIDKSEATTTQAPVRMRDRASKAVQFKIRFLSMGFRPIEVPPYAYVPTRLTDCGIIFTAIVMTDDVSDSTTLVLRYFPDALIETVTPNSGLEEEDTMPGHKIRGIMPIPEEPRRALWRKLFFFL